MSSWTSEYFWEASWCKSCQMSEKNVFKWKEGREIFSFPVHIVFILYYFLQKTLFLSFVMGSLKSHFSFFPDWPLILHFKSKKPQTLKIFSLLSCTLEYSFSWDAFFLYNSSKTLVQMKNSTRSQNILMHAETDLYILPPRGSDVLAVADWVSTGAAVTAEGLLDSRW